MLILLSANEALFNARKHFTLAITAQPADRTVSEGTSVIFTIAAEGTAPLTYQWQYQMPGGTAWTNTTLTGAKTASLTVPATAGRSGCKYRCVVTDAAGNVAYSNVATLTVK